MDTPWNNSEAAERQHTDWSTRAEFAAAMRHASCVSATINRAADRLKLPSGGYGYLGVCNDSVAMVQAGLQLPITQFPCIVAGEGLSVLARTFQVCCRHCRYCAKVALHSRANLLSREATFTAGAPNSGQPTHRLARFPAPWAVCLLASCSLVVCAWFC